MQQQGLRVLLVGSAVDELSTAAALLQKQGVIGKHVRLCMCCLQSLPTLFNVTETIHVAAAACVSTCPAESKDLLLSGSFDVCVAQVSPDCA